MNTVTIHPAIENLDTGSLCYSIYIQLYHNFFNAQDKQYIKEGDETSVRLRNTAYNFADAIAGGVAGEGSGNSGGGILLEYLKKSGGDMSGMLRANYGFEAGIGNTPVIRTFVKDGDVYGASFTGDVEIGGNNLIIGGSRFISYDRESQVACINNPCINFLDSKLLLAGELIIGEDKTKGIYLSPAALQINGKDVYHAGNANLATVDWSMGNGYIGKNLSVAGKAVLSGMLEACYGASLGYDGNTLVSVEQEQVGFNSFLSFASGFGIKMKGIPVLMVSNEQHIQLGAVGGDILLGSDNTNKTRLLSGISDIDGDHILLSRYGAAYFPDSLTVRHNYGDILFSSYRVDKDDEGMIIHKNLRFTDSRGAFFTGDPDGIAFSSALVRYVGEDNQRQVFTHKTIFLHNPSVSRYAPMDRLSNSFFIRTDADFFFVNKPLEAQGHIGINNSFTRLTDGGLFFSNEKYLLSATDGIKHYGNAYFMDNLSSGFFSSGFAGSGWAVIRNKTSGNIAATFDELTIRKKMRIYELEVQKISATNGALWVSDNCSGDTVEKL
ncbi:hypothetical protein [Dysgonomonas termitidis]|uniref:Uncharacterized protein n=1 Tax=Dysgonomonas termitidis TaxID=1516126 RepID=A0ABV9KR42_9BACT